MRIFRTCFSLLLLVFLLVSPFRVISASSAQEQEEAVFLFSIDDTTAKRGYTVSAFDGSIRLGIRDGVLLSATQIRFKKNPVFDYSIPKGKRILSDIIEFDILDKEIFSAKRPLFVELSFSGTSMDFKRIYFWDSTYGGWRRLPGQVNNEENFVRGVIHLPFARLAVLEDVGMMEEGSASWYEYRECDCAASPDYERGTKLRVINTENNKSVIVTVNDFGPDRTLHPNRVIDLDKTAFSKLASPKSGIIHVKVEPIQENQRLRLASIAQAKIQEDPFHGKITARAAALIDAKTGELLWGKNYDTVMSIASLTKLMSAQIFLDTNTPWDKVVSYHKADDEPGSRLYVYHGETMTTRDLYYAMLTSSTNNAVHTLVRSTALGEGQFIDLMNKKAQSWGLVNTHFQEVTGLDPKNVSTAYEMALLSKKVLQNFEVLKATTLPSYSFYTINTRQKHVLRNTNPLVHSSSLYLTGGKTGFLDEAGYCLMTRAKSQDGREVIAVILGAENPADRAKQTEMLLEWGLDQLIL